MMQTERGAGPGWVVSHAQQECLIDSPAAWTFVGLHGAAQIAWQYRSPEHRWECPLTLYA